MTQASKNNGCLWFVIIGILTIVFFAVVKVIFTISGTFALLIAIIISVLIAIKITGKASRLLMVLLGVLVFLCLLGMKTFVGFILKNVTPYETEKPSEIIEEVTVKTTLIEQNDTIPIYSSNRIWKDNYGTNYSGNLDIRERDYLKLYQHTNNYQPPSSDNFWGNLYQYIDQKDSPSLDLVMKTFQDINTQNHLNQMEFAEMVVTCIQDIPYSFVFQEGCLPAHNYEESIRRVLKKCPECCIGDVLYGIQNPVSFLQNLKGDCDTRTVLIYSILKHFNYDVAILNSEFYRHSIIGVNLPTNGLHKVYRGKKYALWETTATYYRAGYLPTSFNDIAHWEIVLTSK